MRSFAVFVAGLLLTARVLAQTSPFVFDQLTVTMQTDAYGIEQQVLQGTITNTGSTAMVDVTLSGEVLNAADEVIGEVFGYTVNACGVALLDDPLQPEETAPFALPIDTYAEFSGQAALPVTFDLSASGTSVPADRDQTPVGMKGVQQVASAEVVAVEWPARDVILYGVGCDDDIFSRYQWSRYDLNTKRSTRLPANPSATFLTDELVAATYVNIPTVDTRQEDPTLLNRSFLSFIPNTTRIVWQDDKHDLYTADRSGAINRREIHTFLHQYSLRGFLFTPETNLLAYYFGAYGEPVRYITANAGGVLLSNVITINPVSSTVPGVQYDGRRVIISGTFDGVTGYYFQSTQSPQKELLFEVSADELAGNNYPAPAYFRQDKDTRFIYVVRPVAGQAVLQCYHYEGQTLRTLTPLPLQLATDERAWSWLSPDGTQLAVAANGRHAGLWLVDLGALATCE